MSRGAVAVDRVVTALLGLLLLAGAVWLVAWTAGVLPAGLADPEEVRLGGGTLSRLTEEAWWPWAVGLGGLALAVLGLAWLLGHVTSRAVGRLVLAGDGAGGGLDVDAGSVASAAAAVLARERLDVSGASGRVRRDGRDLVLDLDALLEPDADLEAVARACDEVTVQARRTLARDDLSCRIRLRVGSRSTGGRGPS